MASDGSGLQGAKVIDVNRILDGWRALRPEWKDQVA